MKKLTVALPGREYDIVMERGLLDKAGEYIREVCPRAGRLYIVTDSHVAPLWLERLEESLAGAGFGSLGRCVIPAGEESKNTEMLAALWEDMAEFGLTRTDGVVALGGGVVGDLAGFGAATILRGVDLIQIPTTLLAQVDSSVGGKTAIDLKHGKNLAGCFYQPKAVLMDPDTLDTLSDKDFADGMAEVIKYGCILDGGFLAFLEGHLDRRAVMEEIEHVLYTCCELKRQVVQADERDTGARMVLNFGHTVGHAYELAGHFEKWTHGQAVAAGMVTAARLGEKLGITPPGTADCIEALCRGAGLPTHIPCTKEEYAAAIGLDKKGSGEQISVILLERLGKAAVHKMDKTALLEELA